MVALLEPHVGRLAFYNDLEAVAERRQLFVAGILEDVEIAGQARLQELAFFERSHSPVKMPDIGFRLDGLLPMIYEAREVVDFKDKAVRETHTGKPYTPPKDVFDLYTSAEVHNKKPRRKLPTAFYVFGLAAALAIGLGVYVYKNRIAPHLAKSQAVGEQSGGLPPPAPSAALHPVSVVPNRIVEAMTPTDDHNPLSAPLYAAVVPPVVAPEIVGCVSSRSNCSCYSQQATPVFVPDEQCRDRAAGQYYDPYRQPMQREPSGTMPRTAAGATATVPAVPSAQASEMPSSTL